LHHPYRVREVNVDRRMIGGLVGAAWLGSLVDTMTFAVIEIHPKIERELNAKNSRTSVCVGFPRLMTLRHFE
jgi:hypothetical protein